MQNKYIIYSADFKPKDGGVADYAYHLAMKLHKENRLIAVLTFQNAEPQHFPFSSIQSNITHQRDLGKRFGDNIPVLRKLNTLFHNLFLYLQALQDIVNLTFKYGKHNYIIVSYYGYYQGALPKILYYLGIPYEIVLHGLDILVNEQQIPSSFTKISQSAKKLIFNS